MEQFYHFNSKTNFDHEDHNTPVFQILYSLPPCCFLDFPNLDESLIGNFLVVTENYHQTINKSAQSLESVIESPKTEINHTTWEQIG